MKANIPDDWDNESWASKCIQWPDSPLWLSVLSGLIASPSNGRNWTRESGIIKDAIAIGNEIWSRYQAAEGCSMTFDVRQQTESPCYLEKSAGGVWTVFADLSLCAAESFGDPPYTGDDFELSGDECLDATIIAWETYTILLALNTERASATSASDMFFRTLTVLATKIQFPNVSQLLQLSSALWAGSNAGFAESFITALRTDLTCDLLSSLPSSSEDMFSFFQSARDAMASFFATYEFEGSIPGLAEQVCLYLVQAMHTTDFMRMYVESEITTGDCGTCVEEWFVEFDFTVDDYSEYFAPENGIEGVYEVGTGWRGRYNSSGQTILHLFGTALFAATPFQCTKIEVDHYRENSANGGTNGISTDGASLSTSTDAGEYTASWTGDNLVDVGFWAYLDINRSTAQISRITAIRLWGYGTNPFE